MSLHLDARQRAMLQEMGITVWTPAEAISASHAPASSPAAGATVAAPEPPTAAPPAQATGAPPAADGGSPLASGLLRLHAPQVLYPTANPARTPAGLGAGWLIVAESLSPAAPLGGDAGRLLDNMLRAMQLHRHPRVHLAALERILPTSEAGPEAAADVPAALSAMVAALQPTLVLVLGHVAARAALGRAEPLGRLRADVHHLAGRPAVVTYEPAFLLRSQETKAAAWADLCRALAIVRAAGS